MNGEVNERMILAAIEILYGTDTWLARWGPFKTNSRLGLFCRSSGIEDVDRREKKGANTSQGRMILVRLVP